MIKKRINAGLLVLVAAVAVFLFVNGSNAKPEMKVTTAEEKGIKFLEQDWNGALQRAKAENKLVFVDIYATWCGPCKMLKKNTFVDEKVAAYFNEHFVNVSIDGERTVGPELLRKYAVEGYPTLIFTDAEGKPVLYTVGYIDAAKLMQFAQAAQDKK